MTPDQYCQQKAARSGSSFYYGFLFLPPAQRQAITALYAFCREVDDVVDDNLDPLVARTKLAWWREEIGRLFAGSPQHPVTRALAESIQRYNLPAEHFLEVIDGMEMDLDHDSYESFKDLSLYCHRVASMVGLMSAEIFGYTDRATLKYAHNLGMAFQLTNILRDVREDGLRGRVYIPLDELRRFGISPGEIMGNQTSDRIRDLLRFQADRARSYYRKAFELLPAADRYTQRGGLAMAAIYLETLKEIAADNYNVLEHRVSLTPIRKLWLAWKTMQQEKRQHRKRLAETVD
ncbi:MAG: presqualene diphosphate synthase HpnD [Gammaproteobacteria bacterium]|nr:presqualene diphosphate synthase HpnD [Gammaproteobacteria bacterium]